MSRFAKRNSNGRGSGNRWAKAASSRKSETQRRLEYLPLENRHLLAAYTPFELLVQFEPQDLASRAAARQTVGGELLEVVHTAAMVQSGFGALERIRFSSNLTLDQAIARIEAVPGVRYADPNWIYSFGAVSDDTHYTNGNLWGMFSDDAPTAIGPSGTTNVFGTGAEKAWNNGVLGSKSVYVAVLDTGIDFNHPDLNANIWTNPFDLEDGIDNDGNGKIDDLHGWDFESDDNSIFDTPSGDQHGTHVAGTIGAVGGNGIGVAGVNWDVNIISTKIGTAGPSITAAIAAMDYLIDLKTRHGLNIVATNNSWGGTGFSQPLLDAVVRSANAGILTVAASGNSAVDNDAVPHYPSSLSTIAGAGFEAVIAVASIDSSGAMSSFSNFGLTSVDLAAPGGDIWSTLPDNSYASFSGTSMASPHVTGAAALYASAQPGATATEIRDAILNSAAATASLAGFVVTGGRLDVAALVATTGPNVTISDVSVTEGNSGTKLANFVVSLSEAWPDFVAVNFATSGQSATAGVDFVSKSGTLTFLPGELSKTISVVVNGDFFQESNETFRVSLSAPVNCRITDGVGIGTILNDDAQAIGEIGVITNLNSNWRTITFQRPFFNPVVVMGTPSRLGAAPITIRTRNVKPAEGNFHGSFDVRVDEWEYLDGVHGIEKVNFMVFEAGRHVLDNGFVLVAGTGQASHRFTNLSFGANPGFSTAPIVFAQVASTNEIVAATARISGVTPTGFTMKVQEEEASDRIHASERIDWVAMERGRTAKNGLDIEGGQTPTAVNHNPYAIGFQSSFATAPAFFSQMQSYLGGDPAVMRYLSLTPTSAQVFIEEERSADNEIAHNNESVAFLAMELGLLFGGQSGGPQSILASGGSNGPAMLKAGPGSAPALPSGSKLAAHVFGSGIGRVGPDPKSTRIESRSATVNRLADDQIQRSTISFQQRADAFARLYAQKAKVRAQSLASISQALKPAVE